MGNLFKVILMVIVFSGALVPRAIAEVDKVFSFLLNEPVSMLHFGLRNLNQEMRDKLYKREEFSETEIYVGYPAKKTKFGLPLGLVFLAPERVLLINARQLLIKFETMRV